jgi:hypothetical protein
MGGLVELKWSGCCAVEGWLSELEWPDWLSWNGLVC